MHLYKWFWLLPNKKIIQISDIEKLEVTYGITSKGQLQFYLVNNNKIITVDLNFINHVEGELEDVNLSHYAPSNLKIKFILSVAKKNLLK